MERFKQNQNKVNYLHGLWTIFAYVEKTGLYLATPYKCCSNCQNKIGDTENVVIVWVDSDIYPDTYSEVFSDLTVICSACINKTDFSESIGLIKVHYKDRKSKFETVENAKK